MLECFYLFGTVTDPDIMIKLALISGFVTGLLTYRLFRRTVKYCPKCDLNWEREKKCPDCKTELVDAKYCPQKKHGVLNE